MSKIAVGIPSRGPVHIVWAIQYAGLKYPVSCERNILVSIDKPIAGSRNNMAWTTLDREYDYLFFIDDDVLIPDYALVRMHYQMQQNDDWDAITGVYATKTSPPEPLIFGNDPSHAEPYWDWKMGETFPVWGAGLGCCLIRASAFHKLIEKYGKDEPFFAFQESGDGLNSASIGEDLYFFKKLYDAGGKVMCDGAVICGHMDLKTHRVYQLWKDCKPYKNASPEFLADPMAQRVGNVPVEELVKGSPEGEVESEHGDSG